MSDEEIRALVEELRAEADYRGQAVRVGSDKDESVEAAHLEEILNRGAAALTALMAERDEARVQATELLESRVMWANLAKEHQETGQRHWEQLQTARRAAFARAKEIAIMWGADEPNPYSQRVTVATQIAAAIEAEMRSDEVKHSVDPLAELEAEVKHDPDA